MCKQLRPGMGTLSCCPVSWSGLQRHRTAAAACSVIGPLDPTYCASYRVLMQERKKLPLEIRASWTWVSVDRLKLQVGA